MILFYAPGAGLGHITRVSAFANTFEIKTKETLIIGFEYIKLFEKKFKKIFPLQSEKFRNENFIKNFLIKLIKDFKITDLIIDTFPAGIYGELNGFSANVNFYLISRVLKWNFYKNNYLKETPSYKKIYQTEKLYPEHELFLKEISKVERINLKYPSNSKKINIDRPYWLIIHSQPLRETEALLNYSLDLHKVEGSASDIILISLAEINNKMIKHIKTLEASAYFEKAEKIITAAGFNNFWQTKDYREKTIFKPFFRRYDDQFFRKDNNLLNG